MILKQAFRWELNWLTSPVNFWRSKEQFWKSWTINISFGDERPAYSLIFKRLSLRLYVRGGSFIDAIITDFER